MQIMYLWIYCFQYCFDQFWICIVIRVNPAFCLTPEIMCCHLFEFCTKSVPLSRSQFQRGGHWVQISRSPLCARVVGGLLRIPPQLQSAAVFAAKNQRRLFTVAFNTFHFLPTSCSKANFIFILMIYLSVETTLHANHPLNISRIWRKSAVFGQTTLTLH